MTEVSWRYWSSINKAYLLLLNLIMFKYYFLVLNYNGQLGDVNKAQQIILLNDNWIWRENAIFYMHYQI